MSDTAFRDLQLELRQLRTELWDVLHTLQMEVRELRAELAVVLPCLTRLTELDERSRNLLIRRGQPFSFRRDHSGSTLATTPPSGQLSNSQIFRDPD